MRKMGLGVEVNFDFLSVTKLAHRLAANDVQGWQAAMYLMIGNILYIVFAFVAGHLLGIGGSRFIEGAIVEAAIAALLTVLGTRSCYNAYPGTNFIQSFIVLSVPALIYSTILSWLIHKSIYFAVQQYGKTTSFATADAANASMAMAARIMEGGAAIATTIGLVSFYFFVRKGLKIAVQPTA